MQRIMNKQYTVHTLIHLTLWCLRFFRASVDTENLACHSVRAKVFELAPTGTVAQNVLIDICILPYSMCVYPHKHSETSLLLSFIAFMPYLLCGSGISIYTSFERLHFGPIFILDNWILLEQFATDKIVMLLRCNLLSVINVYNFVELKCHGIWKLVWIRQRRTSTWWQKRAREHR